LIFHDASGGRSWLSADVNIGLKMEIFLLKKLIVDHKNVQQKKSLREEYQKNLGDGKRKMEDILPCTWVPERQEQSANNQHIRRRDPKAYHAKKRRHPFLDFQIGLYYKTTKMWDLVNGHKTKDIRFLNFFTHI